MFAVTSAIFVALQLTHDKQLYDLQMSNDMLAAKYKKLARWEAITDTLDANNNKYIAQVYDCSEFTRDGKASLEARGYLVSSVRGWMSKEDKNQHAWLAIHVDPQTKMPVRSPWIIEELGGVIY